MSETKILAANTGRSNTPSTPFQSVAEIESEIKQVNNQIDSGLLKIADERKALAQVSPLNKQGKVFSNFDSADREIDDAKGKLATLCKVLESSEFISSNEKRPSISPSSKRLGDRPHDPSNYSVVPSVVTATNFHQKWNTTEIEAQKSSLSRNYFLKDETLLVDAELELVMILNGALSTDQLCKIKTKLDHQGALRAPNTYRAHRYKDSHTAQVQGSALGMIPASGTVTQKRRSGQTMKDVMVKRWRHDLSNPMDF
ncbi:hypothetical protein BJ878DRAFT_478239 [Calycina marina]|uniref:Uncharacterized protein n=1 Tax=Calycina marina TaxID=1763456 RepID=A0A9P7Z715_9HELO|nr:hypothetical protein BJ878DRAFT_478239 [Calycina marina]